MEREINREKKEEENIVNKWDYGFWSFNWGFSLMKLPMEN